MYKVKNKLTKTLLHREATETGESIEEKVARALHGHEPIEDTAPLIFTARKDGVLPQYDIRTDRQELALDATDKYTASARAQTDDIPDFEPIEKTEKKVEPKNE